jgi:hypothetical protein
MDALPQSSQPSAASSEAPVVAWLSTQTSSSTESEVPRGSQHAVSSATASSSQPTSKLLKPPSKLWVLKSAHSALAKHIKNLELLHPEDIKSVEVFNNAKGSQVCIQARGNDDCDGMQRLVELAKEAVLEGIGIKTKNVYIIGFRANNQGFHPAPQGFRATIGHMEESAKACWHLFKKGFCRHGKYCKNLHPSETATIDVVIECMQLKAPTMITTRFQHDVACLVRQIVSTLAECSYVASVEAVGNNGGWSIEVSSENDLVSKECFSDLAMGMLSNAQANNLLLMRHASEPFTRHSNSFTATLANVEGKNDVCYECYSIGFCRFHVTCKFRHPSCFMPIEFATKPPSQQITTSQPDS